MPLELKDPTQTWEIRHPSGAVFILRHWTVGMQTEVDKACFKIESSNGAGYSYDIPREREMKVDLALVDWRGVTIGGEEVPCTPENKKKLPVGAILWIIENVDRDAGLRMTEDEKKN